MACPTEKSWKERREIWWKSQSNVGYRKEENQSWMANVPFHCIYIWCQHHTICYQSLLLPRHVHVESRLQKHILHAFKGKWYVCKCIERDIIVIRFNWLKLIWLWQLTCFDVFYLRSMFELFFHDGDNSCSTLHHLKGSWSRT